jgi:hypothetical protein
MNLLHRISFVAIGCLRPLPKEGASYLRRVVVEYGGIGNLGGKMESLLKIAALERVKKNNLLKLNEIID